jgi:hypothetical protein
MPTIPVNAAGENPVAATGLSPLHVAVMKHKKWTGLAILIVVAMAAFALDQMGRQQQPRRYVVHFSGGLDMEPGADSTLDLVAARMRENPDCVALVKGHTGTRGDPRVNHDLSRDRIETFALGGKEPLERLPDEGSRSYTRRLRRVEIILKPL